MKFEIRNLRGIERADIEASRIALLGGTGGAGKSSICFGVSAVVTGQPVVGGVKAKSRAGELIRAGNSKGSVNVSSDKGQADIAYPKAEYAAAGTPPQATKFAAGVASLPEIDAKKRPQEMAAYIQVEPTKQDLIHHLSDADVPEKTIDRVWETIEQKGWDGTLEQAKNRRVEIKALWREVTGEEYGAKKAETWVPQEWSEGLESESLSSLQQARSDANAKLEEVIGKEAVAEDRLNDMKQRAGELGAAEEKLVEAKKAHEAASKALLSAKERLTKIPTPSKKLPESACPECGTVVGVKTTGVDKYALVKIDDSEADETEAAEAARVEAENAVANAVSVAQRAQGEVAQADARVAVAKQAGEELAAAGKKGGVTKEAVDKAREAVRSADGHIVAFERYTKAAQHHASIMTNQKIIDAVDVDGVRKTVLLRGLKAFNAEHMEPFFKAAKWPAVLVTPDLSLEYDGRDYDDLSRSEKFRARVILQLAMAKVDGSDLVVIDDLDVLPPSARGGALQAVVASGKAAVIAMMTEDPKKIPDLARMGAGCTYWISGGVATPLSDLAEKAAA